MEIVYNQYVLIDEEDNQIVTTKENMKFEKTSL